MGGTTGLGLSAARACLSAGARVVGIGRSTDRCQAAAADLGIDALVIPGDATLPQTAELACRAAVDHFGRLDGIYHIAGGSGRRFGDGPLHQVSDEGWQQTLDWNLSSMFYSNRAALRLWMENGSRGVILNMSSVLAFSPSPRFFATHTYAIAKAGVLGLTKAVAAHYAPFGIRCNAIAPAVVETPMAERAKGDSVIMDYVASKQPLHGGRMGQAKDLDAAVVFLLSDESRYVTGQVLAVDGGWSVTEGHGNKDKDA